MKISETWKHGLDDPNWHSTDELDQEQNRHSGCKNEAEDLSEVEDGFGLLFVDRRVGLLAHLDVRVLLGDVRHEDEDKDDANEGSDGREKRSKLLAKKTILN